MFDKTIHHRRSVRLPGYDYGLPDFYFITICAADKNCIFGRVVDGMMKLNRIGIIVQKEWINTEKIRNGDVKLHEYVIMPNHVHMIVEICRGVPRTPEFVSASSEKLLGVRGTPLQTQSKTLGAIIRGFKSATSKQIGHPVWQRNYYEHIIRNNADYDKISNYIFTNPQTWDADVLFQKQIDEFNERFE